MTSFSRHTESLLIKLESYHTYLVDPPEVVPLVLPFNNCNGFYVNQHIYFPETAYRQAGVPPEEKDFSLNWMRRISYNQIIMRREQEIKLHNEMDEVVIPPPQEVVRKNLEDFAHLDIIGAALVGKIVSVHPEVQAQVFARPGKVPAEVRDITPSERVEHFDSLLEKSVSILDNPQITPKLVLSSAMKRMAQLLGNKSLESEADQQLRHEDLYYPLRMPKLERLFHLSNTLLLDESDPVSIVQPIELVNRPAPQPPVDRLEIAA